MRADPVGDRYYPALKRVERYAGNIYYAAAAFSLTALMIDRTAHPGLSDVVQVIFVLLVIALFFVNLLARLHISTAAQEKRSAYFVTSAFGVHLITETSEKYYSNHETAPFKRVAASLLENCLYSEAILKEMLRTERFKTVAYASCWLAAALYRQTDLAILAVAAQVIFGEQVLSQWIRMEWLRSRVSRVYTYTYKLLLEPSPNPTNFAANALKYLLIYETSKAQAGLSLSTEVFDRIHSSLRNQWSKLSETLDIKT